MRGVYLSTLNIALFISLCSCNRLSGWWRLWGRNSKTIVTGMSSVGPSTEMTSQRFNCTQSLTVPVEYFELNVTLNTSAVLANPDVVQLDESSPDRTWHFLTSVYTSYPVGDLQVQFTLIFNDTPGGDCLFAFKAEGEGNSFSTFYPNITTMTSCVETMTPSICNQATKSYTTPKIDYESANTTVNNTYPQSNNGSKCLCPCECAIPMSKEKSDMMMAAILEDLRIPKYSTSFSKRKLSSAPDYRISCTGIGLVGMFVLVVVFGMILIGDLNLFLFNARMAISHIRGHYGF